MEAGLIEDATRIWWDLRPSARYPTLETRIMDVCTRIEDTVALAALLVCIFRMLYRLRSHNQRWRIYTPMLIRENRWRAMRYSFDEGLIDLAKGVVVPFEDLVDELLSLVAQDARALGCVNELARVRNEIESLQLTERVRRDLVVKMREQFGEPGSYGVFIRSDTNVEDLPQFTGAGLNETIPNVVELNIGHFLVGEAIFGGLESAIKRMRALMDKARAESNGARSA